MGMRKNCLKKEKRKEKAQPKIKYPDALTGRVNGKDDGPVLQLYGVPLAELGGDPDGAQRHPQGGRRHRAVVERQVVAEVPGQVVPKAAVQHDLARRALTRVDPRLRNVCF